jgi:hypothetical protein
MSLMSWRPQQHSALALLCPLPHSPLVLGALGPCGFGPSAWSAPSSVPPYRVWRSEGHQSSGEDGRGTHWKGGRTTDDGGSEDGGCWRGKSKVAAQHVNKGEFQSTEQAAACTHLWFLSRAAKVCMLRGYLVALYSSGSPLCSSGSTTCTRMCRCSSPSLHASAGHPLLGSSRATWLPDLVPRDHPLPLQPALATAERACPTTCSDGGGTCESGCAACSCGSGCATLERSRQRGPGIGLWGHFGPLIFFPIIFIYFKF